MGKCKTPDDNKSIAQSINNANKNTKKKSK